MSNVIDFLERMGQDARLRQASCSEMQLALKGARVDPELQAAIHGHDQLQLSVLLGSSVMCCMQFPAKEDEDDDTEEKPPRENEDVRLALTNRPLACQG